MNRNTLYALVGVLVLVVVLVVLLPFGRGNAVTNDEPCVPSPAIPATPGTPAIPAVPGTPEVPATPGTPAVPAVPAIEAQHYSLKGGSKLDKDGVPPTPQQAPELWQANASQEPVGHHTSATDDDGSAYLPGEYGLHFTSAGNDDKGNGKRDWFYFQPFVPGTPAIPAVPGTPAIPATPGTPEVPAVPGTPAVPAVECPETPTETPTVITPTETPTTNVPTPETPAETPSETPAVTPETPEQETPETPVAAPENDSPVESVVTHNSPHKTVKVYTHEDGTTSREVIKYPKDAVEEGL